MEEKSFKTISPASRCESCEFYDYDEDSDSYCCNVGLDQDEYEKFVLKTDLKTKVTLCRPMP